MLPPKVKNDPLARALASIRAGMNQVDHEAFARLVLSQIDKEFLVESEAKENVTIQWWDAGRKVWVKAGGGRRLCMKVVDVCRKLARPVEKNGERGPAPTWYGNKHFFAPICDIVKSYLPAAGELPPLDGDQTRGLVRFSCGTVLDLRSGVARPGMAQDRISKSTGYRYAAWNAPRDLQDLVAKVVDAVVKDWEAGATSIDHNIFLTGQLDAIKKRSKVLALLFDLVGTWDLTLWLLCQITRAVGALPRFEETPARVSPDSVVLGTLLRGAIRLE